MLVLAHDSDFPKIPQTRSNLVSPCSLPLVKWPQALHNCKPVLLYGLASPENLQAQHNYQLSTDHFVAHASWPWAGHRWQLTLACTSWETPDPAHPVESFRPHQSISQPPPQGTLSKSGLSRYQSLAELSTSLWDCPCPVDSPWW